jgi:ribosome-associated protein
MKKNKNLSSEELSKLAVEGMEEKKAQNIVLMDLRNIPNAITDFFVISSGTSDTQIDAIATSVEENIFKKSQEDPWQREGRLNKEWILLDYSNVVVHVFKADKREFYDIESLWGDAEFTYFDKIANTNK